MSQTAFNSGEDAHHQMMAMLLGFAVSQIIRTTVELSIADHLADGPLTADEIAGRESSAPGTTLRLMRGCVTIGLLTADSDGRFYGTPLLETLRSNAPRSLREIVLAVTNRAYWLPWNAFGASVRIGRSQAHMELGMEFFDYLERNPALAREFTDGMTGITALWALDLADAIDTTDVRLAVDIGGANGALLARLQENNSRLQGIIFDRPNITHDAKMAVVQGAYAARTKVVGGDFFQSVPTGDLYLLKFILHDWDDERCVKILRRCREAMEPDGRVAIVEMVVGDDSNPGMAALMDLSMLAVFKGRERSLPDFDKLLNRAGLRRTIVHTTGSPQSVIEAVAA